jgi:isopenicillin N synthase-like dioxygenase
MSLPVIDVSALVENAPPAAKACVAEEIAAALHEDGFFYAIGHGISAQTFAALDSAARTFFALPEALKLDVAMSKGGKAWRGYFPVGEELTSGMPDQKEGFYFGTELSADHPAVKAGLPLHGANLVPARVPQLRDAVLNYMEAATNTAHALMEGIAISLGLPGDHFRRTLTHNPTCLFRIFHYPSTSANDTRWGVGEHTDYGLLTLLATDTVPGLEVKTPRGWIDAPPIEGALICNIGDMLDRLTAGRYRSNPHRVRNISGRGRLSFPFFFDPSFSATIAPLPGFDPPADPPARWDGQDLSAFQGVYGDWLVSKVSKVFPQLSAQL